MGPGGGAQYFPPVLKKVFTPTDPPQTIISLSVQTATCDSRAAGALVVLVGVQLSVLGSYLPPVLNGPLNPPQTIISLRVQTAVCWSRPSGALVVLVAIQLSVLGLHRPPVLKTPLGLNPPQTIISLPVQTAVWLYRPAGALVGLGAVQLLVPGLYRPPVSKKGKPPLFPPRRSFHCRSRLPYDQVGQRAR